jgi:hypothetical protein
MTTDPPLRYRARQLQLSDQGVAKYSKSLLTAHMVKR